MAALAEPALVYAQAQQVDLPGPLSGVKDWYIVDSTTVTVRAALMQAFPGTGDYAAIYRFIRRVEEMQTYLFIESLDAARAGGARVVCNLKLTTFLRNNEAPEPL